MSTLSTIVLKTDKPIIDFALERNCLLAKVPGDWVLFVDSDEVVSGNLAAEIRLKIEDPKYQGYYLRRLDSFWGKTLRFGETGNIKLLRLARKDAGRWERKVHEVWTISGKVGELKNPLLHYPHPTISEFINSVNRYTDIDVTELSREGKEFGYFTTLANPIGKFLVNYFLKLGFLDGNAGLVYAFMMSLHSLIVRVKLYDLSTSFSAAR